MEEAEKWLGLSSGRRKPEIKTSIVEGDEEWKAKKWRAGLFSVFVQSGRTMKQIYGKWDGRGYGNAIEIARVPSYPVILKKR